MSPIVFYPSMNSFFSSPRYFLCVLFGFVWGNPFGHLTLVAAGVAVRPIWTQGLREKDLLLRDHHKI